MKETLWTTAGICKAVYKNNNNKKETKKEKEKGRTGENIE